MKHRIQEWFSIKLAKSPRVIVLGVILLFNIVFFLISALVISRFNLKGTESMNFIQAAYCTITMILDAGCISYIIGEIGTASVATAVVCLIIIFVGMISFTGAIIGYITNYISGFLETSSEGKRRLHISNHVVILNWNTRASEIINDLLYCEEAQKVVVLCNTDKEKVKKEISERISDTIIKEKERALNECKDLSFIKKKTFMRNNKVKSRIIYIVREGDIFSTKQLRDIAIEKARSVIILDNDLNNTICKFQAQEIGEQIGNGNSQTVKALMRVADITGAEYSDDNQRIIVEVTDEWTSHLVNEIITAKQVDGKCNIVPIRVNQVLGELLSQFSIMPELNFVYNELFSNKGAAIFSKEQKRLNENEFISDYINTHKSSIPLTFMDSRDRSYAFYASNSEKNIDKVSVFNDKKYNVSVNHNYWIGKRPIIILGHNSKCKDIMRGFEAFSAEWNKKDGEKCLDIMVIDDEKHLEKMDYYKNYPFVKACVSADIYDDALICDTIDKFVSAHSVDTSVLILSDDTALNENIDANALAYLIYVQSIINNKKKCNPDFDVESIDVIVEIIDPKHYDIANSYSVDNVVISNRYISKMITQIGEKDMLFDFYNDILTFDDCEGDEETYDSKEIYVKKVNKYFNTIPGKTTAHSLLKAVYSASSDTSQSESCCYPSIVLGIVKKDSIEMHSNICLFEGDLTKINVELGADDKIILFSSH